MLDERQYFLICLSALVKLVNKRLLSKSTIVNELDILVHKFEFYL